MQLSSEDALDHTPEHPLTLISNCTRRYTCSLIDQMLLSQLSRRSQACSQAHCQGGYEVGYQAGYKAGFKVGSQKAFMCQWALYPA